MPVTAPALRDPAWPGRVGLLLFGAVLLWPLLLATEFKPWTLLDPESLRVTGRFLAAFVPPAHSVDFLALVARETWRTVAIATAGITLGLVLAVPLALVATRTLSVSALAGSMAPLPRAEILESGEAQVTQTLLRNGATRMQAFAYGLLPQNAAELASYTVYRWECAIRSSVVLGFVGAGGLGQQMDSSLKMFAGGEVLTLLAVFVALVALADRFSAALRKALG